MKPLQVYLNEDLIKKLKLAAIEQGTNMSALVREKLGDNVEVVKSVKLPTSITRPIAKEKVVDKLLKENPEVLRASELCTGHPGMRFNCGRKGCKF